MNLLHGAISHVVAPLTIAVAGTGLLATATAVQHNAEGKYVAARQHVRHTMHLDWQPESFAPRSEGEIKCWQQSDASLKDAAIARDYQGNVYVQDSHSSQLRVVKLRPGFPLQASEKQDWMSDKLTDHSDSAVSTL